jgi:hypothetical protein
MTVAELIKELQEFPSGNEVVVDGSGFTDGFNTFQITMPFPATVVIENDQH